METLFSFRFFFFYFFVLGAWKLCFLSSLFFWGGEGFGGGGVPEVFFEILLEQSEG